MEPRIASKLQELIDTAPPERRVRVNALLDSNLSQDKAHRAIEEVRRLSRGAPVTVLESSKTVTATMPLGDIPRLAAQEGVFWIDVDHEAPIESLIDPEPQARVRQGRS
jgi:hypothetical protein